MKDEFGKVNRKVQLYSLEELEKVRDNFLAELEDASRGEKTSLAFIKNRLPKKALVKEDEVFQVMVIGGVVFEKALVKKINNQIKILSQQKTSLPQFKNKEIFLAFFEKHLDKEVKTVALNFAYPLKPKLRYGVVDGILLSEVKEHKFEGLISQLVGKELENLISKKQKRKIKVTVVNDTICSLLNVTNLKRSSQLGNYAAGVVGAGTNFAFFLDEKTVVNLESDNFDKFPQTETGRIIDQKSSSPGRRLFEKEVAGAYLYQHYNLIIKRENRNSKPLTSTHQLSQLAEKGDKVGSRVAQRLLERSASLIAVQAVGICLFKKRKGTKKLVFVMEGNVFWQGWHYKKMVNQYLVKLGVAKKGVKFLKVEKSAILGGARLVLKT